MKQYQIFGSSIGQFSGAIVAVWVAVILSSSIAVAEEEPEETVALTDRQLELNNEAIMAMQESPPQAEKAVSLINAALVSGPEADLLYVTLGRAYQIAGQCEEAFDALERAEELPGVEGVPSSQIRARLRTYIDDLEEACPAKLLVSCADPETALHADGLEDLVCDQLIEAVPGRFRIEAEVEDMSTAVNVELRGGRQATVEIGLDGRSRRRGRALERADSRVERGVEEGHRRHVRAEEERREEEAKAREAEEAQAQRDEASAPAPPPATEDPFVTGPYFETIFSVPFGSYVVQSRDGALDIGLLVGASASGHIGYALNKSIGFEGRYDLGYRRGLPLGVKYIEGMEENHEISYRSVDLGFEGRTWLDFFGLGFFVEHRVQSLVFFEEGFRSPSTLAGPSITLSGGGATRGTGDGYGELSVRWEALGHGDLSMFSVLAQIAAGYSIIGIKYGQLTGSESGVSPIRTGDYVMLKFGFRYADTFGSRTADSGGK